MEPHHLRPEESTLWEDTLQQFAAKSRLEVPRLTVPSYHSPRTELSERMDRFNFSLTPNQNQTQFQSESANYFQPAPSTVPYTHSVPLEARAQWPSAPVFSPCSLAERHLNVDLTNDHVHAPQHHVAGSHPNQYSHQSGPYPQWGSHVPQLVARDSGYETEKFAEEFPAPQHNFQPYLNPYHQPTQSVPAQNEYTGTSYILPASQSYSGHVPVEPSFDEFGRQILPWTESHQNLPPQETINYFSSSLQPSEFTACEEQVVQNESSAASPTTPTSPTAAKRRRTARGTSSSEPESPLMAGITRPRNSRKGSKKVTADLLAACTDCNKQIARLILRGSPNSLQVAHTAVMKCFECNQKNFPPVETNSPPLTKMSATFRKRHKRGEESVACDVCLRDVAYGTVTADDGQSPIEFQVEVVCNSCDEKYSRCSDCGGGGGPRLGTGKWRSKGLFVAGRKTCSLPHLRVGALSDMNYDVHAVKDIPEHEKDEIVTILGTIFSNTLLSSMCIPEVLEQQNSIAPDFETVTRLAQRGWKNIQPMIRNDVEAEHAIRRYVCIRSCTPNPRKSHKPVAVLPESTENSFPRTILRQGKDVMGFILAEWCLKTNNLFLSVVAPWTSGEGFDATTILIQTLLKRIENDRSEINLHMRQRGEKPLPGLVHTWTMLFFKRDSRMMQHLTKKRGFTFLEEFLESHPETDPTQFPPHRPIYLPPQAQTGWQVVVRKMNGHDFELRRTAEDLASKRKEIRASSRRAKELLNEMEFDD